MGVWKCEENEVFFKKLFCKIPNDHLVYSKEKKIMIENLFSKDKNSCDI